MSEEKNCFRCGGDRVLARSARTVLHLISETTEARDSYYNNKPITTSIGLCLDCGQGQHSVFQSEAQASGSKRVRVDTTALSQMQRQSNRIKVLDAQVAELTEEAKQLRAQHLDPNQRWWLERMTRVAKNLGLEDSAAPEWLFAALARVEFLEAQAEIRDNLLAMYRGEEECEEELLPLR